MEAVFKALADASRRLLLDQLFARDGQTLGELEAHLPAMSRFGVMKHLRVLEDAELITTKRSGREKLHFLNPVPIRLVHDRWISKFAEPIVGAMAGLKHHLEAETMTTASHVYQTYIRTTPERLWQALTDGDLTKRYFYGTRFDGKLEPGALFRYWMDDGAIAVEGHIIEVDPPRRLAMTWRFLYDPELASEEPSRVTYEIEQRGATCLLRATHDMLGPRTEEHVTGGWPFIVSNLKSLLETGEALVLS